MISDELLNNIIRSWSNKYSNKPGSITMIKSYLSNPDSEWGTLLAVKDPNGFEISDPDMIKYAKRNVITFLLANLEYAESRIVELGKEIENLRGRLDKIDFIESGRKAFK